MYNPNSPFIGMTFCRFLIKPVFYFMESSEKTAKEAYRQILNAVSDIEELYDIYCPPPEFIEVDEERFYFVEQKKEM